MSRHGERPATLANPDVLARRRAALGAAHIAALERYRVSLGARPLLSPHFDPFDGGVAARLLILLETPGPSVAPVRFVSCENPTGTAANLRRAFAAVGIERADMVIWNTVPWVLQRAGETSRAPRQPEIDCGLKALPALLDCLPRLGAVVLAGRTAGLAEPVIETVRPGLGIVRIAHPSPTYVNTHPDIFPLIVQGFAKALATVSS